MDYELKELLEEKKAIEWKIRNRKNKLLRPFLIELRKKIRKADDKNRVFKLGFNNAIDAVVVRFWSDSHSTCYNIKYLANLKNPEKHILKH